MCGDCGDNEDLTESFSTEVLKFIETHSKSVDDVKKQWNMMMGVMKEADSLFNPYLDKVMEVEPEEEMDVEEEEEEEKEEEPVDLLSQFINLGPKKCGSTIVIDGGCGTKIFSKYELRQGYINNLGKTKYKYKWADVSTDKKRTRANKSLLNPEQKVCIRCYNAEHESTKENKIVDSPSKYIYNTRNNMFNINDVFLEVLNHAEQKSDVKDLTERARNSLRSFRAQRTIREKKTERKLKFNNDSSAISTLWKMLTPEDGGTIFDNVKAARKAILMAVELEIGDYKGKFKSITEATNHYGIRRGLITAASIKKTQNLKTIKDFNLELEERLSRKPRADILDLELINNWLVEVTREDSNGGIIRCRNVMTGKKIEKGHLKHILIYNKACYYEDFLKSKVYENEFLANGKTVGLTKFREAFCDCMSPPNERSCEDPVPANLRAAQYALENLQRLDEFKGNCNCEHCTNENNLFKLLLQGEKGVRQLFCPKVRVKDMEAVSPLPGNDGSVKTGPVFLHKKACCISEDGIKCTNGNGLYCKQKHCSNDGEGTVLCNQCPIYEGLFFCKRQMRSRRKITVRMYDVVTRGSSHKQVEMTDKKMKPRELFDHLKKSIYCYMASYVKNEWYVQSLRTADMKATEYTAQCRKDFNSSVSFTSQDNVTCSTPNTCVSETSILNYGPEIVTVPADEKKGLKEFKKIKWKTKVFQAIGATSNKKKDNDAAFHYPVLCKIIEWFIQYVTDRINQTDNKFTFTYPADTPPAEVEKLKHSEYDKWKKKYVLPLILFFLLTDQCTAQYYGCKAFWFFSQIFERYGIPLHHLLAPTGKFKGPHDSQGHIFKKVMRRLILGIVDSWDIEGMKSVNIGTEYFKLAYDKYPQPKAITNLRHYHKFTVDEIEFLFVAYTQRTYNRLCADKDGRYKNNIVLNDRSKKIYDMQMKGSRNMDYIYTREADVNYGRKSFCVATCCWDRIYLKNDISLCKDCKHQDWAGSEMIRYQSPTYGLDSDERNAFRLSIDKGKVFCSPVPESEVEAMVEKSRPYGYQIAYNLLQIQSKPFKSTVAKGGHFHKTIGGKRKRFETYYDKNTWVVLVRFAEYIKNLEWKWGEYAVVEIVALAATDFEIIPNDKRQTSDDKKNKVQRFTLDGSDHEALCTLDGIDDTGNDAP